MLQPQRAKELRDSLAQPQSRAGLSAALTQLKSRLDDIGLAYDDLSGVSAAPLSLDSLHSASACVNGAAMPPLLLTGRLELLEGESARPPLQLLPLGLVLASEAVACEAYATCSSADLQEYGRGLRANSFAFTPLPCVPLEWLLRQNVLSCTRLTAVASCIQVGQRTYMACTRSCSARALPTPTSARQARSRLYWLRTIPKPALQLLGHSLSSNALCHGISEHGRRSSTAARCAEMVDPMKLREARCSPTCTVARGHSFKTRVTWLQVHDVRALRLIVSSKRDCYAALREVERLWPCAPGRFKVHIYPRHDVSHAA